MGGRRAERPRAKPSVGTAPLPRALRCLTAALSTARPPAAGAPETFSSCEFARGRPGASAQRDGAPSETKSVSCVYVCLVAIVMQQLV